MDMATSSLIKANSLVVVKAKELWCQTKYTSSQEMWENGDNGPASVFKASVESNKSLFVAFKLLNVTHYLIYSWEHTVLVLL